MIAQSVEKPSKMEISSDRWKRATSHELIIEKPSSSNSVVKAVLIQLSRQSRFHSTQ
jgi:hypothetical protein